MQSCFISWVEAVHQTTAGELLNVEGKTLRGAVEAGESKSLIHMVSVWSREHRYIDGRLGIEQRYYLLSIESDVHRFADAVRHHWSIENQLHWVLDVGFQEDSIRTCSGHSAENLAVVRQMGLNLLSQDRSTKVGMKTKRLKAGWNDDYLKQILTFGFAPSPEPL